MHTLLEQLLSDGPVVTDGAWGTQLQARGLSQGASPDAWNLEFPERVEEVPRTMWRPAVESCSPIRSKPIV